MANDQRPGDAVEWKEPKEEQMKEEEDDDQWETGPGWQWREGDEWIEGDRKRNFASHRSEVHKDQGNAGRYKGPGAHFALGAKSKALVHSSIAGERRAGSADRPGYWREGSDRYGKRSGANNGWCTIAKTLHNQEAFAKKLFVEHYRPEDKPHSELNSGTAITDAISYFKNMARQRGDRDAFKGKKHKGNRRDKGKS